MSCDLHGRSLSDDAFYEWLLSDHPDARAERDYRRSATYRWQKDNAAAVRAWADKVNASPGAPKPARDLAASLGPRADQAAARAEADYAEPDDIYVGRLRAQHEKYMRVSGPIEASSYRYPEHLTGPPAANYPAPPEAGPGHGQKPGPFGRARLCAQADRDGQGAHWLPPGERCRAETGHQPEAGA